MSRRAEVFVRRAIPLLLCCSACQGPELTDAARALVADAERLMDDVREIAAPRDGVTDEPHHDVVRALCRERLTALGFTVEEHAFEEESPVFGPQEGVNVIGRLTPDGAHGPALLLGAHYDSVAGCAGADDNASGVAALFEAARLLSTKPPSTPLIAACWDLEEWGLLGARNFAREHAAEVGRVLNLESVGVRKLETGTQEVPPGLALGFPLESLGVTLAGNKGDFIALVADEHGAELSAALEQGARELELPTVRLTVGDGQKKEDAYADLRRSDHAAFWDVDVPAVMITDTAEFRSEHYHCIEGVDDVDDLDGAFLADVTTMLVRAVASVSSVK